ncbi:MAG: FAD-binding oxidoreductase, partial [Fibrobacterales bacterium]|nr:FAD-binding oxidoreductase [Fibrobacterales bacterium]
MTVCSWGKYPKVEAAAVQHLAWRHEKIDFDPATSFLAHGMGRSYGDSCLNEGGTLLMTRGLDRFVSFDPETGDLRVEAGVTLEEILRFALPRGYFLPASPGTCHVTVGGAIANDVHGKNHHVAGTFGCVTDEFTLLRSSG